MLKIGMDNIDKGEWLIDIGDALPMYGPLLDRTENSKIKFY